MESERADLISVPSAHQWFPAFLMETSPRHTGNFIRLSATVCNAGAPSEPRAHVGEEEGEELERGKWLEDTSTEPEHPAVLTPHNFLHNHLCHN